jgi:hypothetical protein
VFAIYAQQDAQRVLQPQLALPVPLDIHLPLVSVKSFVRATARFAVQQLLAQLASLGIIWLMEVTAGGVLVPVIHVQVGLLALVVYLDIL